MIGWLLFGAFFVLLLCFGSYHSKLTAIRALDSAFTLMNGDEATTRRPTLESRDTTNRATTTKQNENTTTQRVKRYVSPFTAKQVAARQHFRCNVCHRELDETWETDHKVPLWMGGSNEIFNLQALCRSCHISKSAREASRG